VVPSSWDRRIGTEQSGSGVDRFGYVVLSMGIMTRMGNIAFEHLGDNPNSIAAYTACSMSIRNGVISRISTGQRDYFVGVKLWRQRAAREEVPGLAHRVLLGRRRRVAAEHMLILAIESPEEKD